MDKLATKRKGTGLWQYEQMCAVIFYLWSMYVYVSRFIQLRFSYLFRLLNEKRIYS